MKNNLFQSLNSRWTLLLLALSLLACGRFQFGLQGTATPQQDLPATIAALQTENAQLATQLDQATTLPTATPTSTPTPTPTASATVTPSATSLPPTLPPTPSPEQAVSQATLPPASPTRVPTIESGWIVQALLVFPGVSGRLYVLQQQTEPTPQARLLTSDDFGRSWTAFLGGLPVKAACLRNLNLDYATLDALYASTCQGLYRWSGSEWRLISAHQTGMVAILYGQPNRIWATAPQGPGDSPVLYSDSSGETWTPASRFLSQANGVATLAFDSQNTNIVYAVIWPEYSGSYLRRTTGNGQWETLPTPHNNAPISVGFTIDGGTSTLYVISEAENSQLWRSPNPAVADVNTIRWERVLDFGPGTRGELLASGWSPQGLALYANLTQAGQPVLHRSEDGGHMWIPLAIEF